MNFLIDIFSNPLEGVSTFSILIVFTGCLGIFLYLFFSDKINFDRGVVLDWLKYFPWATLQQIIVVYPFLTNSIHPILSYFLAIIFFSFLHFWNVRLMLATSLLGVFIYAHFFILGNHNIIQISMIHALGAIYYKRLGWDMRAYALLNFWRRIKQVTIDIIDTIKDSEK